MEVSKTIQGTKEKCFSILMESLLEDIALSKNKKVKLEEIGKGYSYTKQLKNQLGKEGKIRVTILELQEPSMYKASFESAQGINTLSYVLEDVDDTHFELTYNEDFLSEKKSNNLNYGLMAKLYKRS
ncbi:MAG: DUF3284 domain-containing protein, partial [Coprobacillaceae bacterium]